MDSARYLLVCPYIMNVVIKQCCALWSSGVRWVRSVITATIKCIPLCNFRTQPRTLSIVWTVPRLRTIIYGLLRLITSMSGFFDSHYNFMCLCVPCVVQNNQFGALKHSMYIRDGRYTYKYKYWCYNVLVFRLAYLRLIWFYYKDVGISVGEFENFFDYRLILSNVVYSNIASWNSESSDVLFLPFKNSI